MPPTVAIIGYSFRLPNTTQETFWNDLLQGRDLVSTVPKERWSQESFCHPRKDHPGTSYTFAAGSVGDVSLFDAGFFGISPREAAVMDPQQRLLLELGWEACEHAGIRPSSLKGSRCGVYVGISNIDYAFRITDDLAAVDSSSGTGNTSSIAANRLSYFFDLHGPSMAIDTACSSSLVAFHQACLSIISGESDMALAGGVSLHLHPYTFIAFSKASMLSRKGHCNVFDAACDGYVRSEGAGLFLLKEYQQAVADGDRILAVVAASAVNTDGRKSGLTVPSATAQASLLKQTYLQAGIAPPEIDYLEAHGTGTAVGDPIEVQAIGEALGTGRPAGNPLLIGSVKSNLGHLESAAGVAGLVKALLCIQNRTIPPTIGITQLNPAIPFNDLNIEVATEYRPITKSGEIIVGVNSFGFGGANAHVVLKSHEHPGTRAATIPPHTCPLVLSAKDGDSLRATAKNLATHLADNPHSSLYDITYNTLYHRERFEYQAVFWDSTHNGLADQLQRFANAEATTRPTPEGTMLATAAGPAFVYSGNGAQWFGMGKELLSDPLFRKTIQEIDFFFTQCADWSLEQELSGQYGVDRYADTEIAQPALFAIQIGITRMLHERGIRPQAVTGHSVGEVAAAWACGALSLEAAVAVIYHRSRLQGTTKGQGQMTAVGLGEPEARQLLVTLGLSELLTIAGSNSSKGVTIAGPAKGLKAFESALTSRTIFNKRLALDYAFHSPAMDPLEPEILSVLSALTSQPPTCPFYSTVTGNRLAATALDAVYWWHNLRKPVQFDRTIKQLLADGTTVFIEISPNAILRGYLQDCLHETALPGRVITTGLRGDDGPHKITEAVSHVMISGAPVDWTVYFPHKADLVRLPHYPWQREQHWHTVTAESYGLLHRYKLHPLLGYRLPQQELTWENQLDTQLIPLLADHQVGDAVVFPGAGFAELALAAAHAWQPAESCEIEELEIHTPLLLKEDRSKLIRATIEPTRGDLSIKAREVTGTDPFELHLSARILQGTAVRIQQEQRIALPERRPDFTGAEHHQLTIAAGLGYGPAFQVIRSGWIEHDTVIALYKDAETASNTDFSAFHLHPAYLDCAFQLIFQLMREQLSEQSGIAFIPVKIGRMVLHDLQRIPQRAKATLVRRAPHSLTAEFVIADANGSPIASIFEVRFRAVRLSIKPTDATLSFLAYQSVPSPHPLTASSAPTFPFQLFRDKINEAVSRLVLKGTHRCYSEEVDPLLDVLCSRFTLEALQPLADAADQLDNATLQDLHSRTPLQERYLDHLLRLLVQDGLLTATETGLKISAPDTNVITAQDIWNSLFHDYPDYFPILHSVSQVGLHLHEIFTEPGAVTRLPALGSLSPLTRNLLGAVAKSKLEDALHRLVTDRLTNLSAGNRLGIIEISDGMPLFASTICQSLDFDQCSYLFATPNSETADEARQQLERFPAAGIQLIEPSAPFTQPLACQLYDLAIILSDFQSTETFADAVDTASARLAPQGVVLFIGFHPSRWIDFVFGGHTGWWRDNDSESPLSRQRPPAYWQNYLEQHGFTALECHELSPRTASGPYLLLGCKSETASVAVPPLPAYPETTWLILADEQGDSARLAGSLVCRLNEAGGQTFLSAQTSAEAIADQLQSIKGSSGKLSGILHLSGLQQAVSDDDAAAEVARETERCATAAALVRACEVTETSTTCCIISANAVSHLLPIQTAPRPAVQVSFLADAALWGLGRTLINELPPGSLRMVDLELPADPETMAAALVNELIQPDDEQEICISAEGKRFATRLRLLPAPVAPDQEQLPPSSATPCYRLGFQFPGQLRNLRWEPYAGRSPQGDEIEVEVHATGLNFRDFMYALGLLSDEAVENGFAGPTLGMEFSGTVVRVGEQVHDYAPGDHLVGFGPACFSNRVITRSNAVSLIPVGLSFEAAVTIPATFFTSFYALHYLARLAPGEKVLIHGAAGGVGIAAIQVARWSGAEIHATAGTDEKRDFLRMLGIEYIYDSRSLLFADELLARTGGVGVDVVLNSLSGEAINRNLRILKPFGRFLELGKRDYYENTRIGLRPFRNNISYFGIDADQLMQERPDLTRTLFKQIMALFTEGVFHPLPFQTFDANDIIPAFRYMQQSRQIGKVVVTYRNGVNVLPEQKKTATGSLVLPADTTFLITGGLSGFGLKTAEWLAQKGARNLVLISRSGPVSEEARQAISSLHQAGVTVHAAACDVTDKTALTELLAVVARTLPPLTGIVHAAMVIQDGLIKSMERQQISQVLAPKILGATYLHQLTQELPLKYFILFSSATTLFGNPGQGNYVAANHWLEAFAAHRQTCGLPVTCVGWSPIDDAGFLAQNQQIKDALQSRLGGEAISASTALDQLEKLLLANQSGLGVLDLDWKTLSRSLPSAGSPKFMKLAQLIGSSSNPEQKQDIRQLLAQLSETELLSTCIDLLKHEVGVVLRIDPAKIDQNRLLSDMGLDSLMGVELAVALESLFGVKVPVMVLSDSPTIAKLAQHLLTQLSSSRDTAENSTHQETVASVQQVVSQHGEEVPEEIIEQIVQDVYATQATDEKRMIQ